MIVNLRESLNTRDRKSVNGNSKYYDLVNLYESCNLSADNKKTLAKMINNNASDKAIYSFLYECYEGKEDIKEDTVKKDGKWVNKGKEGTHGEFKTKKAADAQRKAMFANGYKGESLKESVSDKYPIDKLFDSYTIDYDEYRDRFSSFFFSLITKINKYLQKNHSTMTIETDDWNIYNDCEGITVYLSENPEGPEKFFEVADLINSYLKTNLPNMFKTVRNKYMDKSVDIPFSESPIQAMISLNNYLDQRNIGESLNDSIAVKMSRDDFDRMCREGSILKGLSDRDYTEVKDSFYIGYENFDAAANDLWAGDDGYHSRDWYDNLLRKYTGKVNESLKESVNSDIVSMIKKQFPEATVKTSVRKHSDVHKSNPDTPVGKTKYVDIRITPDSASSVNSILQYCNHNIKKVLDSDSRFYYYGDVPARNPRGSKEVVLSYQDYSGLSDDEYRSLLGESVNPADLTDCPAEGEFSWNNFSLKQGDLVDNDYDYDREEGTSEYEIIDTISNSVIGYAKVFYDNEDYANVYKLKFNTPDIPDKIRRMDFAGNYPLEYSDDLSSYCKWLDSELHKRLNESLKESLESEDGWSEEILDIVDPFFIEVEKVAYELRNTVRGAYRFGTTVEDLVQVFRGFSETADDIANELDDNQEHLEEDWCSIKEEPHKECVGNNCTDEHDLFPEEKYFTIVVTRSDDGEDEIIDDVTKEIADKYIDDLKRDNDEFFSHAKVLDHNGEVVNSWEYLEEAAKSKKSSSIKDRLKKLIPDLDI